MVKKVINKQYHYHYYTNPNPNPAFKKSPRVKKLEWTPISKTLHRKHLKRAIRIMNLKIIDRDIKKRTYFSTLAKEELSVYFNRPSPVPVKPNTAALAIIYKVYFNFNHYNLFDKLFHVTLPTLSRACELMFNSPK